MLLWRFGPLQRVDVHVRDEWRTGGTLELERADVTWFLSASASDLPGPVQPGTKASFRLITVDDEALEFSEGFTDLHTRSYEEILAGRGYGTDDSRPSIELAYQVREREVSAPR
jgi:UDP-N-acetyl-2-amino-2-deoxyglucuronate dehydrogenase